MMRGTGMPVNSKRAVKSSVNSPPTARLDEFLLHVLHANEPTVSHAEVGAELAEVVTFVSRARRRGASAVA
jgi:hypothetical protein